MDHEKIELTDIIRLSNPDLVPDLKIKRFYKGHYIYD